MARNRRDSLSITKPIQVFNPRSTKQMLSLSEVIRKFTVIDDFSKQFLIWLLEHTGRLSQSVSVEIPLEYQQYGHFLIKDVRMITDMWHLNLILKCMDSHMQIYCSTPEPGKPYWKFQVTVQPDQDPNAAHLTFDPVEIEQIDLS